MADLANSEDMLNSEAVLDIFRKLPLLNFNPMVKPPEIPSHVPPRGWLSSNTSDLPTKFRVVETIWPELIETIKTYIDLGGIKAHLLGPRSYFTSKMSHCLEDMAPVPWQPRDGTGFPTSADVNEYVIGPMQILSEDIRQSRITGQSGDTVPKMKWMHLFPFNTHTTIRTLPDLHLHEANPTINSIKGPMCATIALLPFFELPSEAIDSIDACLAHPETVADSCGMVCCPLDDSAIASSLITRVSTAPSVRWFRLTDLSRYGGRCHTRARRGVSSRTPNAGGSSRLITTSTAGVSTFSASTGSQLDSRIPGR